VEASLPFHGIDLSLVNVQNRFLSIGVALLIRTKQQVTISPNTITFKVIHKTIYTYVIQCYRARVLELLQFP
jgi:hypothetical protein